ncbi:MAG TPA: FRG domain-containing protein [Fimbriimonadaceae bacterium]|nr:FRG domain-containing protein [Fimbriimonadaceae bacterium]
MPDSEPGQAPAYSLNEGQSEEKPEITFEKHPSGYMIIKTEEPIWSVHEYLRVLESVFAELGEREFWFRGVSRQETPEVLRPKLFRTTSKIQKCFERENALLSAFAREGVPFLPATINPEDGFWQLYHLMQHYGVPTRLLDWSESSLVGLYFALRQPPKATQPKVWILDPYLLQEHSIGYKFVYDTFHLAQMGEKEALNRYKVIQEWDNVKRKISLAEFPEHPVSIFPPHVDRRITTQRSVFTVHGSIKDGLLELARSAHTPFLYQLPLDSKWASYMRTQLWQAGITEATLFPDLEGLARHISQSY